MENHPDVTKYSWRFVIKLSNNIDNLINRKISADLLQVIQSLSKILSFDEFHHQIELATLDTKIKNRNNIAVIQVHHQLRFFFKHVDEFLVICKLRKDSFHSNEFTNSASTDGLRKGS